MLFFNNNFDNTRELKGYSKSEILKIKNEISDLKSNSAQTNEINEYLEQEFKFHLLDEYSNYVLEIISFIQQYLVDCPKELYNFLKTRINEELSLISRNLANLISNAGSVKRHLNQVSSLDNFIVLAKKVRNDINDILPNLKKNVVSIEKEYENERKIWIKVNKIKNLKFKMNPLPNDLLIWDEIMALNTFIISLVEAEGVRRGKSRKEKINSFHFDELYQFISSHEKQKLELYYDLVYFLYKKGFFEEFEKDEEFVNVLERKQVQKTIKQEIKPVILAYITDNFEPIIGEISKLDKEFDIDDSHQKGNFDRNVLLKKNHTDLLSKIVNLYFNGLDKKFQDLVSDVDDQETNNFVKIIDLFYSKIDALSALIDEFDTWLLSFDKYLKPYENITSSLKKTLVSLSSEISRRKEEYANYLVSIKDESLRIEVRNLVDKKISEVNKIISSYEDETSKIIREELPQLRKVREIIKNYKAQIELIKDDVYTTLEKYKDSNVDMYNIIRYWEKNFNRKKQQVTFLLSILVNKIFKSFKDLIDEESILFAEITEITKQAENFEGIPFNFALSAFLAERLTEEEIKERVGEIEAKINQLTTSLGLYQVEKSKLDEILSNKVKIRAGVSASNVQCTVCHKNIDFSKNQVITCPFCGSTYHYLCVADWLSKYNSCPMCQNQFLDPNLGLFQS
ncbi:MAG: hypothetical protein EU542_03355 [Promethearchaeota archaeon]|nr:MAG: hypothetical protein EU542_03355 [Candidatus Lokiarchaeota archaeon]